MSGGDVRDTDGDPADVDIVLDVVVLAALAGGRVDKPEDSVALGVLETHGDEELARRVLENMAFTS